MCFHNLFTLVSINQVAEIIARTYGKSEITTNRQLSYKYS